MGRQCWNRGGVDLKNVWDKGWNNIWTGKARSRLLDVCGLLFVEIVGSKLESRLTSRNGVYKMFVS